MALLYAHPHLGAIKGICPTSNLVQFRALPYASAQRFARSVTRPRLPKVGGRNADYFDATKLCPSSIQPLGSVQSDAKSNQFPIEDLREQDQSEDCLHLTITAPQHMSPNDKLPVLVFLHGGAFFIGSGDRQYYSPINFCSQATTSEKPLIFVSVNYRLGALGFFHCPSAPDLVPANNGLHDQLRAFQWIQANIPGFGGDAANITAIGQSAGGESLSLINTGGWRNLESAPYRRSILFSGSPVTMPAKTPEEHQEIFLSNAENIKIPTDDRPITNVVKDMTDVSVTQIRSLSFVGAPCSQSDLLLCDKPSILHTRHAPPPPWLESQIVSSASYDGGISYNMLSRDCSRKKHAAGFIKIANDVLMPDNAARLLQLYDLKETDEDDLALRKICQFESDVGFFFPALALAEATFRKPNTGPPQPLTDGAQADEKLTDMETKPRTYFQLFDIGNPFPGPLPAGHFATHTWDIVALLGAYESHPSVSDEIKASIKAWRDKIISYVCDGRAPWPAWTPQDGTMLIVQDNGTKIVENSDYLGAGSTRGLLRDIAEREGGEGGMDVLWQGVCRRWLMDGK